jgi:uncharacterized protein YdhG (YjbR/CyaY superfamily)
MAAEKKKYSNIDEYIAMFPKDVREILEQMRRVIADTAPSATETISYAIPTFKLNGKNLVHFAAFKKHIGFYPASSGIAGFQQELSSYKNAKGSVQFPFDQPVPFELVKKIVEFRVKENDALYK